MVAGPARRGRSHASKTKGCEIEFVHEPIDDARRIVFGHVVVQAIRQQRNLMAIRTQNEPRHTSRRRHAETIRTAAFSHSLGGKQSCRFERHTAVKQTIDSARHHLGRASQNGLSINEGSSI